MAQSDVLKRNGGGAAEKGAEEGSLQRPTVRDEGLAKFYIRLLNVEF
jgi:hypothetical protein